MGNSPFDPLVTSTVSSINQQIPWSKEFTLLDKQPLNSTYILHHIPSNSSYKVKHMTLNKTQHSQIFRQIDMRKNSPSPFVTKLQKTQMYTVKGYCSQHEEVFLMYKYVETNLKQEILNRRFRNQKFYQEEIKVILQAGVKGISYLNEIGLTPKGLNASQILLTPQRAVLLNDPWLSLGSTMSRSIQPLSSTKQSSQMQNGSKIFSIPVQDYPSPQKILFMNDLIQEYNQWLSQLFTFGVIVLEAIFMESLTEQLYDKSQKKIYYHKVKQKIEEITTGMHLNVDKNGRGNENTRGNSNSNQNIGSDSSAVLSEIKEDLRRLLSHQPRIRESVYLKNKKNHASYLFLKKPKEDFRQNASLVNQNKVNSLYPQDNYMKLNNYDETNNFTNNQAVSLNKDIYTLKDQLNNRNANQYETGVRYSKLIEQSQKQQQIKPSWMTNNMTEQPQDVFNKGRQNYNKLRVISSSLPNNFQPANPLKSNPYPTSNEIKKNDLSSPPIKSEYFIYNQFNNSQINKEPTNSLNNNHSYHHLGGGGHHRIQENKPITSYESKYPPIITQNSTSYLASQRQNQFIPTNYLPPKNYLNNNKFQLPNTYGNLNYLTQTKGNSSFYGLSNLQSLKPMQISKNIRTVELSPKKQTLVQKQPQYKPQHWRENTEKTPPSSRYISTSSSNNFQPPANQIFTSQTYKSQFPPLSNDYNSNIFNQPYTNAIKPVTNFPSYNVVRSESSYIFKGDNSESNNLFTGRLPQVKRQSWTYEGMIGKDELLNKNLQPYLPYQEKANSFLPSTISSQYQPEQARNNDKDKEQAKTMDGTKRPPSKISLSQTYNKYPLPNTNSNNNPIQNPPSEYQASTLFPNTPPYPIPLKDIPQQKPSSYAFGETKNYSRFSPNYQDKSPIITTDTYPQQLSKIPSSKELNNFQFREVGSVYYEDSHFLNDKESIVIESYTGSMSKLPSNRTQTHMSSQNSFNIPKMPSKESFEINHSMIGNGRNEGKSFSSMDEDVKELRKFGQQKEMYEKKPNSSYSSSEKVSVIDRIYEPQVMESQGRGSFDQSPKKEQSGVNGRFGNRSSQNINRSSQQKIPSGRKTSQSYLQTPERYPGKERMNSTIREASCEESGVNNSNSESYENSMVYPNTQISKYQAHEERRFSERKVQESKREREKEKERENNLVEEQNNMKETSFFANHTNNINQDITENQTTNPNLKNDNPTKPHPTEQKVTLYADGSRYIGETDSNGESHGYGVLYYPDGQVAYQGEWLHGDFNGKGKLYNPYQLQMEKSYDYRDLTRMDEFIKDFEGVFFHDVKEGKGVLRMHNNEVYEGQFSGDLPHGRGKFSCWDGNVVEGIWERGLLSGTF